MPGWIESGAATTTASPVTGRRTIRCSACPTTLAGALHAQGDDITWTREDPHLKVTGDDGYPYEPVWINPAEAAAGNRKWRHRHVYNERGAVLGGAYVTERIRSGVAYMDHGARYDPIIPGELDRGGAINTITPHKVTSRHCAGMATSGFLVDVAPADLEGLRKLYPEAFARPYHDSAGLLFERVLAKDCT